MVVLCGFILIRLNIVKYCNCAKHGMAIGLTTECVEHVVWRLAECIFSASPSFSLTPWVHISHCFDPAGAPRGRTQSLVGAEPRVSRSSWELGIGRLWHPKIYVRNANLFAERVGEIQWTQRGKKYDHVFCKRLWFQWHTAVTFEDHHCHHCQSHRGAWLVQDGAFDGRRVVGAWIFLIWQRDHVQGASWWLFCTNSWVEFHDWSPKKRGSPLWTSIFGPDFWVRFWSPDDFFTFAKDFWKHFHVGSWVAVWLGWSGKRDTNWERIKRCGCDWLWLWLGNIKSRMSKFLLMKQSNSVGTVPFKPRKN